MNRPFPKYLYNALLVVVTSLFFSSCSNPANEQSPQADVLVSIDGEHLQISNQLPYDVYYFITDQESLPYIFWIPTLTDSNVVVAGSAKTLAMQRAFVYEKGEPVVVFYWDEDVSEVFEIVLE